MRNKIYVIIITVVILICLIFLGSFLYNKFSRYGVYKCYLYQQVYQDQTIDLIDNYEYYNLKLNRDKTFVITYKNSQENSIEIKATGTFTDIDNIITLYYIEGQDPMESLLFDYEVFTLENRQLIRNQSTEHSDVDTTIKQKFKK